MKHKPIISIILPTYNGCKYLQGAIKSCIMQTFNKWELIIIDDCSTDETPNVLSHFLRSDDRIQVYRNKINMGLPYSLNRGFNVAAGVYLTWTSDDNYYRPTALDEMFRFLNNNENIDIVYTDYTEIDAKNNILAKRNVSLPEMLAYYNCIGPCFLFKREVYTSKNKYSEDLFLAEDYDFWLRSSGSFVLKPLHKNLYFYRHHSDSLTYKKNKQVAAVVALALERNLPNLYWMKITSHVVIFLRLAKAKWTSKNYIKGCKYLYKGFFTSPRTVLYILCQRIIVLFRKTFRQKNNRKEAEAFIENSVLRQ